ncbi:hypothetical protein [Cellulomonas marina]|uniref:Tfp pilus assembly protein PilN n=1 Tax=Cellulomonas marina TaxID=988821 RepID=A0A1I0W9P4_9CELL|nr:hypothetical protein [Cellulomonas marina]GIG29127.1 hypothetical protein Cma02nite_17270 [Cellulomonas marina]SFA84636.1 hypothetical protein SAMN05421867_102253 [Cellulomonas marina]
MTTTPTSPTASAQAGVPLAPAPSGAGRPGARFGGLGVRRGTAAATVLGGPVQVDLLPADIRAGRALAVVKRRLLGGVACVVVLVAAGYAGAITTQARADAELTEVAAQAAELTRQAEGYAQVPQVLGEVAQVEQARAAATSTEVLWQPYVDAIAAVLPAGTSIATLTASGPDPLGLTPPAAATPLQAAGIGSIALSLESRTVPAVADLQDALDALPGLDGVWFSGVTRTSTDAAGDHYTVTVTAQLTGDALAGRYAGQQEG